MTFANPLYFILLLPLAAYVVWHVVRYKRNQPTLHMSDTRSFATAPKTWRNLLVHVPFVLRLIVMALVIIVLARPQTSNSWKNRSVEGIDIMLAVDVSTSMLAQDLKPNRIEAAKQVASEFIAGRPDDNIGLTVFAGEAYTQCPMTTDNAVLLNLFQNVSCDLIMRGLLEDGTTVGMGLVNAVSRLKDSKAKSKVVVLLTDGSNNCGDISPLTAAEIAKSFGVRVYTIAVGRDGVAPYPQTVAGITQIINIKVDIDEKTLASIASTTGGEFYRATDNNSLKQVYEEIDKLEKTKLKVKQFSKHYEAYMPFALAALFLFMIELLLKYVIITKLP